MDFVTVSASSLQKPLLISRCKGSASFTLSDYTCFLDDRFDRNPISLSPSSCCSCCANSIYRVPINPSFLCGLKQSTLIQWSPCRRLILGGVGPTQCYSRFLVSDIDRNCYYRKSYSFKERVAGGRRGKWGKGKYGCMVSEERSKRHRLGGVDDAELMISLLTEEVGEECFGVRDRNVRSSRRLQVEKRRNSGDTSYRSEKKNVGSGGSESISKCEYESIKFQSAEENKRQKEDRKKEEREIVSRGENSRVRKEGSSCTSYYSLSSSGEFESDTEDQVKHDGFAQDSSSPNKRNSKGDGEITYEGEVAEEVEAHGDFTKEHGVSLKTRDTTECLYAASSGVERDWRKKSEKKLDEVSFEQADSRKELSHKLVRSSEVQEGGYDKPSNFLKQYNHREEKSSLAVNFDEGTRQQYSQVGDRITGQSESRMKFKQLRERPEIHSSVTKKTSSSQKQYSGREENLTAPTSLIQETKGGHYKTDDHITRQNEYKRNSQQLAEVSARQEIDIRGTPSLQRHSETGSDDTEHHRQAGQRVTRQMDSRGKSEQLTEISDTHYADIDSTFISQRKSDTRVKKQEENSGLAFTPYSEAKEQRSQMDSKDIRRMESRKESHDIMNRNDAEKVTNTQRVYKKRTSSQEKYSTSAVKSVEETRESRYLTDEGLLPIGSRKVAQRPTNFREGKSEEASSSEASLKLNPQSSVQQIGLDEGDNRSSQATMMPPSSPLVAGDPLHVERTSGLATHEFSSGSLGSGSSALHAHTEVSSPDLQLETYGGARRDKTHGEPLNFTHEDALGSADRLQKSSTHIIGEFVEKVRHEVSTSEVQKEKKTYETMLVHEDEEHKQKDGGQYGSGDSQPKNHESRCSSKGSETKGPSDEMWDVTNPSIQEPPEREATESTTTTRTGVVKRTGRSLWGIIGDIVRMQWVSRSESHNSKSGGKSSPNQSTSSEVWFSGHEADENNDENVKKESRIHAQNQGEGSSLICSKDEIKHVGMDSLSSSNTESDLVYKGISSSSIAEAHVKHLEGTSSGTAIAEHSLPLPAIRMRRSPVVQKNSEGVITDASDSGTMVQIGQQVPTGLTEVSGTEGKDGELKRRKLQRNKQVLKDRFDEWEEAFILETEQRKIDEKFMREALLEAKKAANTWEVPVGAVVVHNGKIIARGYNLVEELRDSTAHAEMICIREASNIFQTWRLSETTLYVTLEPCPMCAGAILQARVDTVVWGAPNKLLGADGSWIRLFPNGGEGGPSLEATDKPAAPVHPFHPNITIRRGVLASECADAMQQFFQLRRRKKEKKTDSPPTPPPSCLPISNRPSKFFSKLHDTFNLMFCL